MKLPFRYQFILAPVIISVLLAGLVAFTLYELSNINRENNTARHWEILTDKIQTAIASATHLNTIIEEISSLETLEDDDLFFAYLEHSKILSESLTDPYLISQISINLRQLIEKNEPVYRKPELVKPTFVSDSINSLLPALDYQYKLFASYRRTAIIDNHRELVSISSRLTGVLISTLILCIILASGLTFWGLKITRNRLKGLAQRAYEMCAAANPLLPSTSTIRDDADNPDDFEEVEEDDKFDEIDDLEVCLTNMTQRVFRVVSVENALRGAEDERRRIAMDIHDGVLADLTVITRNIDGLALPCDDDKTAQDKLGLLRKDVNGVIKNLRRTIDDLHPQVLDTLGLEFALHSFMGRYDLGSGFPKHSFDFDKNIETLLTADQKLNLFRIVIEAINNVIKHSHCEHFEVSLRIVTQQIIVTVEDNGIGIDENKEFRGHGCANITERASIIGSTVQWGESRFVSGTNFELTIPLGLSSNDSV
jgi:signal transduction histidine kinase